MPTNITVADAAATPVNHTFVAVRDGADALFVNEAALTLKGQETLGLKVARSTNQVQAHTVRLTMWDPTEVTVGGVTSVAYGSSSDVKFNFAPNATLQDRKDIVRMMRNALAAKEDDIVNLRSQF